MQSIYNYFFLTKLSKVISFYEIALHKSQYRLEPESHPRALPDQNIEWHHQVTTTTKFESEGLYSRGRPLGSPKKSSRGRPPNMAPLAPEMVAREGHGGGRSSLQKV